MKTIAMSADAVTVEINEFEVMALAALIERGVTDVTADISDAACIRAAIINVADEFRSLLGHFELAA